MGCFLVLRKKKIMLFKTWMILECIMFKGIGQTQQNKYRGLTHTWNLKTTN